MIRHTCAIGTGVSSVPLCSVPVRSYKWIRHAGHAHGHLLSHYRDFCWEPDSSQLVCWIEQGGFTCNWNGLWLVGVVSEMLEMHSTHWRGLEGCRENGEKCSDIIANMLLKVLEAQ